MKHVNRFVAGLFTLANLAAPLAPAVAATPEIKTISIDSMIVGNRILAVEAPDFNFSATATESCIWSVNGANRGLVTETGPNTDIFKSSPTYIYKGQNVARISCTTPGGTTVSKDYSWSAELIQGTTPISGPIKFVQNNNVMNDYHFYALLKAPEFNFNTSYREAYCKMILTDAKTGYISDSFTMEETEPNSGMFKSDLLSPNFSTYKAKITCTDPEGKVGTIEETYIHKPIDSEPPTISDIRPDSYEPGYRSISFVVKDASPIAGCWVKAGANKEAVTAFENGSRYETKKVEINEGNQPISIRCSDKTTSINYGDVTKTITFGYGIIAPPEISTAMSITSEGRVTGVTNNKLTLTITKTETANVNPALLSNAPVKGKKFVATFSGSDWKNHPALYKNGDLVTFVTEFSDPQNPTSKVTHTITNRAVTAKTIRQGTIMSFNLKRREFKLNDNGAITTVTYSNATQMKLSDSTGVVTNDTSGELIPNKTVVIRGQVTGKTFRADTIMAY